VKWDCTNLRGLWSGGRLDALLLLSMTGWRGERAATGEHTPTSAGVLDCNIYAAERITSAARPERHCSVRLVVLRRMRRPRSPAACRADDLSDDLSHADPSRNGHAHTTTDA
jgi:hypothetical protein